MGEISGLDDEWCLWEKSFSENLEVSKLGAVNDWSLVSGSLGANLLWDEGPQTLNVDGWAVVVVLVEVEDSHSNLSEVSRVVLVTVDAVVMLTSGVTATSRMLPVLSNTSVSVRDVTTKLSGLSLGVSHLTLKLG